MEDLHESFGIVGSTPADIDVKRIISEIANYIQNATSPTLAKFVEKNPSFILQNTPPGKNMPGFWSGLFGHTATHLKKVVGSNAKVNWPVVNSVSSTASADASSSSSSTPQASFASSASSSGSVPLSSRDKDYIKDMYQSLIPEKKWVLSTGKIVENEMEAFALQCNYLHPVHFMIIDTKDEAWRKIFSVSEIKEIDNHNPVQLEQIPDELKEYLESYSDKDGLDALTDENMRHNFHPTRQPELHWAHRAITEALDLFHYKWLPVDDKTTEADVVRRVFPFIEKCFDESVFRIVNGEKASIASSERKNENRSILGIEPLPRKDTGHKVDILITHLDYEFGCGEAGLKGGITSSKWLTESTLKMPKLMKDMLWHMLKQNPTAVNKSAIPGFVINGLNLMIELIDIPQYYACRLSKLGPMPFPNDIDAFFKQLYPLLIVTWQMKATVKATLKAIKEDKTVFVPTLADPNPPNPIPACPPSPRPVPKGKKRKLNDKEDEE